MSNSRTIQEQGKIFESEVRRIASALWPSDSSGGSAIVEVDQIDGLYVTEECIHIVEATISGGTSKAIDDIKSMTKHAKILQRKYPSRAVKCWFITRSDPTAEQREIAQKEGGIVVAMSFSHFQSKIVDGKSYISARDNYSFGSVRDPESGTIDPKIAFIPLDLVEEGTGKGWSVNALAEASMTGGRTTFLGDYGSGKSMVLRETYRELRRRYLRGTEAKFPVYVNLRDHHGQEDPVEVLHRHANQIGFASPSHLVRAWRAGFIILILDGLDEMTTLGITGEWNKLKEVRYRAMTVVRRFCQDSLPETGIFLAGRAHYFDSRAEMERCLGTVGNVVINLSEFTDEQIDSYLKKANVTGSIPGWIPARPLLLGYLVSNGVIGEIIDAQDGKNEPAIGWDYLLSRIADRESKIEAGIDGFTIRRLMERIATKARKYEDGLGPISVENLSASFLEICGYHADDMGRLILQRLPGLGVYRQEESTRKFVDTDFADACRAGDVVESIVQPHSKNPDAFSETESAMGELGIKVACNRLTARPTRSPEMNSSIRHLFLKGKSHVLMADAVRIASAMRIDLETAITITDIHIPGVDLPVECGSLGNLQFQDCYIQEVGIDQETSIDKCPVFTKCYIMNLDGVDQEDISIKLSDCIVDNCTVQTITTSKILDMDIPLGNRVMLSVLKKLYLQKGTGRKQNALFRGMDGHAQRLVNDVLHVVEAEGVGTKIGKGDESVWLPVRSEQARVNRVISAPRTSSDKLLTMTATLA